MPATESVKASDVIPILIVRPMGPSHLETKFQETNPERLILMQHTATPRDVSNAILKAVANCGLIYPEAGIDLVISALGGTGAGKGVTLMGQSGFEGNGVCHDVFEVRHASNVKSKNIIKVLEIAQNEEDPMFIDVKDLGRDNARIPRVKKNDLGNTFTQVLQDSKDCSIDGLREAEGRRQVDTAEHAHSSRSSVIMTCNIVPPGGQKNYRTTIIDPPGIEDPRVVRGTKSQYAKTSGIAINKTYSELVKFIESTIKGGFLAKGGATQFSPVARLHATGNPVVLCVIAVLYGDRTTMDPDPSVLTIQKSMDFRDGQLTCLLKKLLGASAYEVNKLSSRMHRHTAAKPVVPKQATLEQEVRKEVIKAGMVDDKSGLVILSIGEEQDASPLLQQFLDRMNKPSSPTILEYTGCFID